MRALRQIAALAQSALTMALSNKTCLDNLLARTESQLAHLSTVEALQTLSYPDRISPLALLQPLLFRSTFLFKGFSTLIQYITYSFLVQCCPPTRSLCCLKFCRFFEKLPQKHDSVELHLDATY